LVKPKTVRLTCRRKQKCHSRC